MFSIHAYLQTASTPSDWPPLALCWRSIDCQFASECRKTWIVVLVVIVVTVAAAVDILVVVVILASKQKFRATTTSSHCCLTLLISKSFCVFSCSIMKPLLYTFKH